MLNRSRARLPPGATHGLVRRRVLAVCAAGVVVASGFFGAPSEYLHNFLRQGQHGTVTVTHSLCRTSCHTTGEYRSDDGTTVLPDVAVEHLGRARIGSVHEAWDSSTPPSSAARVFAHEGLRSGLSLVLLLGLPTG